MNSRSLIHMHTHTARTARHALRGTPCAARPARHALRGTHCTPRHALHSTQCTARTARTAPHRTHCTALTASHALTLGKRGNQSLEHLVIDHKREKNSRVVTGRPSPPSKKWGSSVTLHVQRILIQNRIALTTGKSWLTFYRRHHICHADYVMLFIITQPPCRATWLPSFYNRWA